jgi:hypothetical protein
VKPPDDATSTKTKEAAKRERTEEEIDADLALLQGAANTLDPKSRARSTNVVMRRKSEVEKVIGGCIADGKSDYGVEIGLSSKGYGEGLKHSQKGLISDRNRREGEVNSK